MLINNSEKVLKEILGKEKFKELNLYTKNRVRQEFGKQSYLKIKRLVNINNSVMLIIALGKARKYTNKVLSEKEEFRHITVHDLIHTFATRCLQAGMSIRVLQVILGHASIQMTEKYTHLVDDLDIEEMEKLQILYDKKLKTYYTDKEVCQMCGVAA